MAITVIGDATAGVTRAGYSTTNIDQLEIKYVDGSTAAETSNPVNVAGFAGLQGLTLADSIVVNTTLTDHDKITFSSVANTTALTVKNNGAQMDVEANYLNIAGSADTATLNVEGRSGVVTYGAGFETIGVTTTGTSARLDDLVGGAQLKTVTVAGTGLKVDQVLDSTITSFNASTSTGPVNVFLAPGTTLTSAQGGTGTADVLAVTALSTTQTVSGFETIQAQATATYDLSNVTGATTLAVDATVGGTIAATFTNASATTTGISISGGAQRTTAANATNNLATSAVEYGLKTATGLADAVTVTLDNGGVASTSTTVGTLTLGGLKTNGVENVTISTADWKAIALGGLNLASVTATAAASVTASGSANLNVGTLANTAASANASTVNFGGMTGTTTMVYVGADSMTFTGGTGVDTVTNGAVGVGETQTYNLGAGADVFTFVNVGDATGALIVNGEAGNDTFNAAAFTTSTAAATKLDGGADSDTLLFTTGVSMVNLEDIVNVEKIQAQVTGAIVDGGAISGDTIEVTSFAAAGARLQVTADAAGETVNLANITFSGPNAGLIVNGGTGADTITGTGSADTIATGGGADIVIGGGAADSITGGGGVDTIKWTATTAAAFATETGSTAGTSVDVAAGIGDAITTWTSATDKLHFAAAAVTNAAGTETDTLLEIAKGGTVTNVARFVQITDTVVGDAAQTGNGAITVCLMAYSTLAISGRRRQLVEQGFQALG